ncbi:MAG: hypothetical protein FD123_3399 [Bacteroidetes bacterium]|nr:MAG: hypothetical protein FD123_3399 [Bacteroidota bacterium]
MNNLVNSKVMIYPEQLKNALNCGDEFLVVLLGKFIEEISRDLELLKQAAARSEHERVKGIAHKMLGSVRIFNISELSKLITSVEIGAMSGAPEEWLREKIQAVDTCWTKTREEILRCRDELAAGKSI